MGYLTNVEGKLASVVAEIADVVESVKLVQGQIVDVGAKIEHIKTKLEQPNLAVRKEDLLTVEFKSLLDKEAALHYENRACWIRSRTKTGLCCNGERRE